MISSKDPTKVTLRTFNRRRCSQFRRKSIKPVCEKHEHKVESKLVMTNCMPLGFKKLLEQGRKSEVVSRIVPENLKDPFASVTDVSPKADEPEKKNLNKKVAKKIPVIKFCEVNDFQPMQFSGE